MIDGKSITILGVAWGSQVNSTIRAMEYCLDIFPVFDKAKFITDITSEIDYNRFFVEGINNIIDTDFVLNVQADGFIINPNLWSNNFLNFDYVGAPWRWDLICGNGGFSLRSKKFLETCAKIKYDKTHYEYSCAPEDWFLCIKNRKFLISNGIKFADVSTGLKFSFEHPIGISEEGLENSFGFHGKHHFKK
jgi:hypothetical protein